MSNVDRYEAVIGRQLNAFVCPVAPASVLEPVVYCPLSDGFTVHSLVLMSGDPLDFQGRDSIGVFAKRHGNVLSTCA